MAERDWVGSDLLDLLQPRVNQTARTRRAQQTLVVEALQLLSPAPQFKPDLPASAEESRSERVNIVQVIPLLRAEREAQGLSLADVQAATGISRGRLSLIENLHEANLTISTLSRIAAALRVQLMVSLEEAANPRG